MKKILFVFLILIFSLKAQCVEMTDILPESNVEPPFVNLNYNYQSTIKIPLIFHIEEKISTKDKNIFEGQKIKLIASETSTYKGKALIKRGDTVEAEIKYITTSGMNGIPYSLVLNDFQIRNLEKSKLKDEYRKDGFNRTYFVLPLKWSLTFLPPTGSLTNFIKGGHAVISPKDKITIYYFPEWGKLPQ